MRHAIMGLDPGGTTGFCLAVFDNSNSEQHPVLRLTVGEFPATERPTDRQYSERYLRVAYRLVRIWVKFRRTAIQMYDVKPENVILVSEDFILRPGTKSNRDVLAPVYINFAMTGFFMGEADVFEAIGLNVDDLPGTEWSPIVWSPLSRLDSLPAAGLKQAQLWTSGMEHARSATVHTVAHARAMGYSGLLSARVERIPGFYPRKHT